MDRRVVAGILAAVAVVGARLATPASERVPLVIVPQGVSVHTVAGEKVFLRREGTLTLTGFSGRSPGDGQPVVWCPDEGVFLARSDGSLFTDDGRWVAGPSPRDLDRVRVRVTEDLHVVVGKVVRAAGRSRGEVPGEVGLAYDRWLNPRSYEEPLPFCEDPVG